MVLKRCAFETNMNRKVRMSKRKIKKTEQSPRSRSRLQSQPQRLKSQSKSSKTIKKVSQNRKSADDKKSMIKKNSNECGLKKTRASSNGMQNVRKIETKLKQQSCNKTNRSSPSKRLKTRSNSGNLSKKRQKKRVASLNALAKVHCLYENESKALHVDINGSPSYSLSLSSPGSDSYLPLADTRTLRSVPGLRGFGRNWDMAEVLTSSSSSIDSLVNEYNSVESSQPSVSKKRKKISKVQKKKIMMSKKTCTKKSRKSIRKPELTLKDFVVKKRMASLNASAIMAASLDRKPFSSSASSTAQKTSHTDAISKNKLIKVCTTPTAKQVAVIVNHQDTDVTITGVYTSRSTGDGSGYCSMQYRISAASETTTVISTPTSTATDTIPVETNVSTTKELKKEKNILENTVGKVQPNEVTTKTSPSILVKISSSINADMKSETCHQSKSYTPLNALSGMQPPSSSSSSLSSSPILKKPVIFDAKNQIKKSQQFHLQPKLQPQHQSPIQQQPQTLYIPQHQYPINQSGVSLQSINHNHHYVPNNMEHPHVMRPQFFPNSGQSAFTIPHSGTSSIGCYQSVGPLVTVPQHMHSKVQPIDVTTTSAPILTATKSETPIEPTNITNPATYRCNGAPPQSAPHPFIPYQIFSYQQPPGQYYQPLMPPPAPVPAHTGYPHDLLYSTASNIHRRYLQLPPPSEPYTLTQPLPHSFYNLNHPIINQASTHTANNNVLDPYQSMPMFPSQGHFYPVAPVPYGQQNFQTNVPSSRNFSFTEPMTTNATYQNCPCPMQTCPKNVHTGPLTGNSSSKRSGKVPLSPVALALPLELSSVDNPPSPARGSAGMPPPPSPAGAMYQTNLSPPQKISKISSMLSPSLYSQPPSSLLSVSTNSSSASTKTSSSTLLMCHDHRPIITTHPTTSVIKQEVCSPSEKDKDPPNTSWYTPTNIISTTDINTVVNTTSYSTMSSTSTEIKSTTLETNNNKTTIPIEISSFKITKNHNDEESSAPMQKLLLNTKKVQNYPKTFNKSSYKNLIKKTSVYSSNDIKRKCNILNDDEPKLKKIKSSMKTPIVSNKDNSKNVLNNKSSIDNTIDYVINMYRTKSLNIIANKHIDNYSPELPVISKLEKLPQPIVTEKAQVQVETSSNDQKSSLDEKNIEKTSIKITKTKINNGFVNNALKLKSNKKLLTKKDDTKTTIKKKLKKKKKRTKYKKKVNAGNSVKVDTQSSLVVKVQKKVLKTPRWSNGWTWEGEAFEANVFLNCDDNKVVRRCYSSMRHVSGDQIRPRDCVLLLAGSRSTELPFIAKIASLWESPIDGEMMLSLLWYYRPDSKTHHSQELYASKHKDVSSVACIDDKCYVLTFNEYCRFHKFLQRTEEGIDHETLVVPQLNSNIYPRANKLPPADVNLELVYFCRSVYDYRQKKVIKNLFLANYFDKN